MVACSAAPGRGRSERVGHRDDLATVCSVVQHGGQRRQVLRVDHQQLRAGVIADVADLLGGQPGVDRHQDRPGQRDAEVGDQHLRDVRAHVGHPVPALDAGGPQRVRQPGRLRAELAVARARGRRRRSRSCRRTPPPPVPGTPTGSDAVKELTGMSRTSVLLQYVVDQDVVRSGGEQGRIGQDRPTERRRGDTREAQVPGQARGDDA